MTMKTIVALFEHRRPAVRAVRELLVHGISKDRISLVSPTTVSDAGRIHLPLDDEDDEDESARSGTSPMGNRTSNHRDPTHTRTGLNDRSGAPEAAETSERADGSSAPDEIGLPRPSTPESVGATMGIGSVLLGVAFLSLPAVGPVLAAGPLLAGILASGAGVSGMDLPQRLSESGMPRSDAERYAQAIRRGGVLVVLTVSNDDVDDAAIILARHGPVDPEVVREHPRSTTAHAGPQPATMGSTTSAAEPLYDPPA